MNMLAIVRRFLVVIIILFCAASGAAPAAHATVAARTDIDLIQLVGNQAVSQLQALSLLASATCGSPRPISLDSCSPCLSMLVEGSASSIRIEERSANITRQPTQSALKSSI